EKMHLDAQPHHLDALLQFASRAYRRPLSKAEKDDILAYYHTLRDKNSLSHEDAIRDSLVSILVSPDFCYRIDLLEYHKAAKTVTAKASTPVPAAPLSSLA